MVSVINESLMLNVVTLHVIMLSVVAPTIQLPNVLSAKGMGL